MNSASDSAFKKALEFSLSCQKILFYESAERASESPADGNEVFKMQPSLFQLGHWGLSWSHANVIRLQCR